jgi:diguanylate cyclase (GGDEF)-like protein
MNKDQIAIYLNEHLEFFNDYPELLTKIQAIDTEDLPLEPLGTLSLADRIIKRAHADKEHLKSKLEWFVEISQANEKIQEHLFEIERSILTSSNLNQLVEQLREEISSRFAIPHVLICLVDEEDYFIESKLKEKYGEGLNNALRFVDQATATQWFAGGKAPVMDGEIKGDSEWFAEAESKEAIKSEALIPIMVRDSVAGAIVLGSAKPFHFHAGLRTDFLQRMADKMAIALDNIFLIDRLRRQTVVDKQTGLYNRAYLEPVLHREFNLAQRRKKNLSCIKLQIDYFDDLLDTWGEAAGETVLEIIGKILTGNCRSCDILIRTDIGEFLILLPEIDPQGANLVAQRILKALSEPQLREFQGFEKLTVHLGMATYPGPSVETPENLLHEASRDLTDTNELTEKRAV